MISCIYCSTLEIAFLRTHLVMVAAASFVPYVNLRTLFRLTTSLTSFDGILSQFPGADGVSTV